MADRNTENDATQPTANNGLTAERGAQIARENQAGHKSSPDSSAMWAAWLPGVGLDMAVPPVLPTAPAKGQIEDCSKEKCIVNGKQYANSTDIPGNHPTPLLNPDGTQVLGPDKKPIVGPDRVDLDHVVAELKDEPRWLAIPQAVLNFRHNAPFDFQRMMTDDTSEDGARPIFSRPYQNFANVATGYVLAGLGLDLHTIDTLSNTYLWMHGDQYDEPMSKQFTRSPERQIKDFEIGFNLYHKRHDNLPQVADRQQ